MRRKSMILCALVILGATLIAQAAEVRILPHKLNPNGKRARMKVEILEVDTQSVDTSSITLNGIAALKTRVNPHKVVAFFSKKDVIGTLGEVAKGQVHTLSVSFVVGDAASATVLTDDIKIVGKKKKS